MTLAEVTVASVMSTVVLLFSISVFLMCSSNWARGENRIGGETEVRTAVRVVSDELREAMWVSVDSDGMGLTYKKPQKDVNGAFTIPVVWDGVDRRIEYSNGNIWLKGADGANRVICHGVMTKDPFQSSAQSTQSNFSSVADSGSWPTYKIFTPNATSLTTQVTVMIVTSNKGGKAQEYVRARKREVVTLRNVPEILN